MEHEAAQALEAGRAEAAGADPHVVAGDEQPGHRRVDHELVAQHVERAVLAVVDHDAAELAVAPGETAGEPEPHRVRRDHGRAGDVPQAAGAEQLHQPVLGELARQAEAQLAAPALDIVLGDDRPPAVLAVLEQRVPRIAQRQREARAQLDARLPGELIEQAAGEDQDLVEARGGFGRRLGGGPAPRSRAGIKGHDGPPAGRIGRGEGADGRATIGVGVLDDEGDQGRERLPGARGRRGGGGPGRRGRGSGQQGGEDGNEGHEGTNHRAQGCLRTPVGRGSAGSVAQPCSNETVPRPRALG